MDFEAVFKAHFRPLGQSILPMVRDAAVAEDIVQEAMVKLWERRDRIRDPKAVRAYLYRAVYNGALNYLQTRKRQREKLEALAREAAVPDPPGTPGERVLRLRRIVDSLPPRCKAVFVLCKYEGLKYSQIAEELGISEKTVENQMGKALRIIRDGMALLLLFRWMWWVWE